jgi:uncharacterized SAM-dependent methyltransferase
MALEVRLDATLRGLRRAREVVDGLLSSPRSLAGLCAPDRLGPELVDAMRGIDGGDRSSGMGGLLERHATAIATLSRASSLVEIGHCPWTDARSLTGALVELGSLRRYVKVACSEEEGSAVAGEIASEFPGLEVAVVVTDLDHLEGVISTEGPLSVGEPTLVAVFGGAFGLLAPRRRRRLLADLDGAMSTRDRLLVDSALGASRGPSDEAEDRRSRCGAALNRRMVAALNREFDGDLNVDAFTHPLRCDGRTGRLHLSMRAASPQRIELRGLGVELSLEEGEEIYTWIEERFRSDALVEELGRGGFVIDRLVTEDDFDGLLTLAHPYC